MADFGANIIMQDARNTIAQKQFGMNRLMELAQMAQQDRQFNDKMDFERNKPKDFSLNKSLEQALMKDAMGVDLSPQDMAAVKAYDLKNAGVPVPVSGPHGRIIWQSKPSIFDRLNGSASPERSSAGAFTNGINPSAPHPLDAVSSYDSALPPPIVTGKHRWL